TQGDALIENGPTLTFSVAMMPMDGENTSTNSRAIAGGDPSFYDDWIDTQNRFRVLFFAQPEEDNTATNSWKTSHSKNNYVFLFESEARWVEKLPADADGNLCWRVVVPLYQVGQPDAYFDQQTDGTKFYKDYDEYWRDIREVLRKCDFKVAILANHPGPKEKGGGPDWGIKDSYMNGKNNDDKRTTNKVTANWKTINDLHHCTEDATLFGRSWASGKDAYSMIFGKNSSNQNSNQLGPYTDWVIQRAMLYGDGFGGTFNSKETARVWIRNRWNPNLEYNDDTDPDIAYKPLYRGYRNLWYLWNFGGCAEDNALPIEYLCEITNSDNNVAEWEGRNGKHLREWITGIGNGNRMTALTEGDVSKDTKSYLRFSPGSATAVVRDAGNGKKYYGIRMNGNSQFTFSLRSHGSILVTYKGNPPASNDVKTPTSPINLGWDTTGDITPDHTKEPNKTWDAGNGIYTMGWYIKNQAEEKDVWITADNGTEIYQIEFVRDEYLYLTDREGVTPSTENPIPMYGVQNFTKLGTGDNTFFPEGSTFDLTAGVAKEDSYNGKSYAGKSIALIRSVAKIEVLIPRSLGIPKHVLMRSLNRHSRCEPVDVQTPTNELWLHHDQYDMEENLCEWELIQSYGPFYNPAKSDDVTENNAYRKQLSWYWGSWEEWGWDFSKGMTNITLPTSVPVTGSWKKEDGYPHVFNPYINRSDFAYFIDVSDYYADQFYHYVLYMGDNTVDAPTDHYKARSRPMVPHVEIRFDHRYPQATMVKTNDDTNLEDNDCYRFYFVEKGFAKGAYDEATGKPTVPATKWDQSDGDYEKNAQMTKQHWPIMRNHVYHFEIKGV
ncbi:MAG: hypothetical protein J1F20_08920, partial [Muribaculaceae bacterium]|nr:hypothetical protein [Muribaculaceae bacterium]